MGKPMSKKVSIYKSKKRKRSPNNDFIKSIQVPLQNNCFEVLTEDENNIAEHESSSQKKIVSPLVVTDHNTDISDNIKQQTLAVFYLTEAKEKVVGRIDWIYRFDSILAKSLNNRINRNQTLTIFWSKNLEKNPVFEVSSQVRFRNNFQPNEDSLYHARILRCFGELNP